MIHPLGLDAPITETESEARLRLATARAGVAFPERAGRTAPATSEAPSHGPVEPWCGHPEDVLWSDNHPIMDDRFRMLLIVAGLLIAAIGALVLSVG